MICFERVSKRYDEGHDALREVSFEIAKDDLVFLTGHSGAGKSTLMRLVMLMDRATRGKVIVDEIDMASIPNRNIPAHRRDIGVVFQNHQLLFDRCVFDNVALPLVIAGYDHREIGRRVRAALDKVGLLNRERALPVTLSGGEQQMVAVARALMTNPRLLILDEATEGLAPIVRQEIWGAIAQLKNETGMAIIVIDKSLTELAQVCDRATILERGKTVWDGLMTDLTFDISERLIGV